MHFLILSVLVGTKDYIVEAEVGAHDQKNIVKVKRRPPACLRAAKHMDFVTFQFKGFRKFKKFDDSYGRGPVRIQLGAGMTLPGLDKGLEGMCNQELRRIQVPWHLSLVKRCEVWKLVPQEELWLTFDIEMLMVEAWTPELQFEFMDGNKDFSLSSAELGKHLDDLRIEFGKKWPFKYIGNDHFALYYLDKDFDVGAFDRIRNDLAVDYFVKYFDTDNDGTVSLEEYIEGMKADLKAMSKIKTKPDGRERNPGVDWILDFNNDGIVTDEELGNARFIFANPDETLKKYKDGNKHEL